MPTMTVETDNVAFATRPASSRPMTVVNEIKESPQIKRVTAVASIYQNGFAGLNESEEEENLNTSNFRA